MRKKAIVSVLLIVALSLMMSACTSLPENTRIYFSTTSSTLHNLFSGGNTARQTDKEEAAPAVAKTPLATPENLTVDADGNYSFKGVADAEYYLLYFCAPDAVSDEDTFIYSSEPIRDDGSEVYTGKCSDKFRYAFGEYLVKVFAFPDLTDNSRTMSSSASVGFTYTGEQSAPELSYYWNTFSGAMGVEISNMSTYQFEAYPDKVDITFKNVSNADDTVTVAIEGVSPGNYAASTGELKRGETYEITAVASSSNQYVTNPVSDVSVIESGLTLGENNLYTGCSYTDGFANNIFCWPVVRTGFDLENGGIAGQSSAFFNMTDFNTTPVDPREDSQYSYDLVIAGIMPVVGTLELKPDGTFIMSETGDGPINASNIKGTWTIEEEGFATLNYDHSSIEIF